MRANKVIPRPRVPPLLLPTISVCNGERVYGPNCSESLFYAVEARMDFYRGTCIHHHRNTVGVTNPNNSVQRFGLLPGWNRRTQAMLNIKATLLLY
jgi:hypothetical protein